MERARFNFMFEKSSEKRLNPEMSLVDIYVMYHGDNRNGSSISKEAATNALPYAYGIPIVGEYFYSEDGGDFGTHGGRIIEDSQGVKFEETTKPYGFVPQDSVENAEWVTVTEKNGVDEHEYLLFKNCILWTGRYEEAENILDQTFGQSMEIKDIDGEYRDDDVFEITSFNYSALCILGTEVEPCFESASIGRHFELDDSLENTLNELFNSYNKFNLSVEEKSKGGETVKKEQYEKIMAALAAQTFEFNGKDVEKYSIVDAGETEVSVMAYCKDSLMAQLISYSIDENGEVSLDFENAKEAGVYVQEKTEDYAFDFSNVFEKYTEIASAKGAVNVVETVKSEYQQKIDALQTKYEKLQSEYAKADEELKKYHEADEKAEFAKKKSEIEDVLNEYKVLMGQSTEFMLYADQVDFTKDKSEYENDLSIMLANQVKKNAKNSDERQFSKVETSVFNNDEEIEGSNIDTTIKRLFRAKA